MHRNVRPAETGLATAYMQAMSNIDPEPDLSLGLRDPKAREAASVEEVVRKARALGFSEPEIERLRGYYDVRLKGALGEHQESGAGN
ncbi:MULTISPECIES: hypothetical protein [unclassified Roseitalea]|uniref:hypothetical protein n=1 Tax=unclassified Roseitalea TaxID=2639107 RepID=UPI00273D1E7E|nr:MULTISPECIES: hypothetical protein [unclassified Roseitalea]